MPSITESSINLHFPDSNFFRLANCPGYRSLNGHHFKEMDVCWLDTKNNTYWLIELKDFSSADISSSVTIKERVEEIFKKAVDSLCLFLSSKHNYRFSVDNINPCFHYLPPNESTQFKFITIIHITKSQRANVSLLNEQFRNKFYPYAKLFGIEQYSVVEHSSAMRIIPNNIVR